MRFILAILALVMGFSATAARAADRSLTTIPCPRTAVEPAAQARIDAGEKPDIVQSWYKPGLVNPQGFCTVTLTPNGKKMLLTYNEATSVGPVPLRFEYDAFGLKGYIGDKAMPLGRGMPDLNCTRPTDGKPRIDCAMALDAQGAVLLRRIEGPDGNEAAININPKPLFGVDLYAPSAGLYDAESSLFGPSGALQYMLQRPNCPSAYWTNTVTNINIITGTRAGDTVKPEKTVKLEGPMPMYEEIVGPQFLVQGGLANTAVANILTSEAVRIEAKPACSALQARNFLTEMPRVLSHVVDAIKPRMLAQN